MERLHFSVTINAPKERIWSTMLSDDTYRQWTEVFSPGSHFKGDWSEGSKMFFLTPGKTGSMDGMISRIRENRPQEHISIQHLGTTIDGIEDFKSSAVKKWAGALENYTLIENVSGTELHVDLDTTDEFKMMFLESWPKALQILKELSEKQG